MKSKQQQGKQQRRLWMPGATAWECWQIPIRGPAVQVGASEEFPTAITGEEAMVVPSRYLSCLAFWTPTRDAAEIREVIPLLAEKAGAQPPDPEDPSTMDIEVLRESETRALVRYLCLCPALPEPFSGILADFFTARIRVIPPKSSGFYLWAEMGGWILGICGHEHWLWVQPLTAKSVGPAMIHEIRLIWMRLSTEKLYDGPTRLTVWAAEGEQELPFRELGSGLKWMIEVLPRPVPVWPQAMSALMPRAVAELKRTALFKKQLRLVGILAAVVLILALAAMGGHLFYLSNQNRQLAATLQSQQPEVEQIRAAADLWERVEPALSLEFSPLEALNAINAQLPEKGVRLMKYDFESYTFRIEGEATNVQLAVAFSEQLRKAEAFAGYDWSTPSPNNMPGGLASLSIRATRPGAPEGEN